MKKVTDEIKVFSFLFTLNFLALFYFFYGFIFYSHVASFRTEGLCVPAPLWRGIKCPDGFYYNWNRRFHFGPTGGELLRFISRKYITWLFQSVLRQTQHLAVNKWQHTYRYTLTLPMQITSSHTCLSIERRIADRSNYHHGRWRYENEGLKTLDTWQSDDVLLCACIRGYDWECSGTGFACTGALGGVLDNVLVCVLSAGE